MFRIHLAAIVSLAPPAKQHEARRAKGRGASRLHFFLVSERILNWKAFVCVMVDRTNER
jgi:hypothetical protein